MSSCSSVARAVCIWSLSCCCVFAAQPDAGDTVIDLQPDAPQVESPSESNLGAKSWRIVVVKELDRDPLASCLRFSPDGKKLCAAGEYGECSVWETHTWNQLLRFQHHTAIWDVAFSSDGQQLLTCGEDGALALWDLATGKMVQEFRGHESAVRSCAISLDGKRVIGGGGRPFVPAASQPDAVDFSVRIWEVATGRQIAALKAHQEDVRAVAFLPDTNQVLSTGLGDDMLIVWDVNAATPLRTIPGIERDGARERVTAALSFDGRQVVTSGQEMFGGGMIVLDEEIKPHVRLWDLAVGQQLLDYGENTRGEGYASFGPLPETFTTLDLDWVMQNDGQDEERVGGPIGQYLTCSTLRVSDVQSGHTLAAFIRGGPRWDNSNLTGPIAVSPANNLIVCSQATSGLVVLQLVEIESD